MEIAVDGVQDLIDTYTLRPEGAGRKKIEVLRAGFGSLPENTRNLIEVVLREVYRNDFEIVRNDSVKKLEFYLRLIAEALEEAQCNDSHLWIEINRTRDQIAEVVNEVEVSDEDMVWLKGIGFLPVDIFELTVKLDISALIVELQENIEEYVSILGNKKYIVKILKMHQGLEKLKRLKSFNGNYDRDIVKFNGSPLVQIVANAGWEEKLEYFEAPGNLKRLQAAGFNCSHLAQIVVGAGWKEKLKYFENPKNLERLRAAGFNGHHLAQIVLNAGWKEKLKYFEAPGNLERLQDAGFNCSHLAQIVGGAGWKEKLEYFENPKNLERLRAAGFNCSHLAQIVGGAGWKEKLEYFENPKNPPAYAGGFPASP
jgi:Na+-transporting NADH:ubiquinone oxidoreductase subunit NqrE